MLRELMILPEGATIQGQNRERFIVEGLLACGGFSAVYLVRDRRARNNFYVLKESSSPNTYERRHLAFEGEILKRLEHCSLPHVYQVFENTRFNRLYILMEYIEGPDLETLRLGQPDKRFSLSLTLALMKPIVGAVSYLHHQQPPIVHRDIKPANIIVPIGAGEPKLVDFGLAKEYVEEKTTNIFRYGTPGYAAAEQYGQGTNLRTDIYALAATIYTLLSGVVPVDALTRNLEQCNEDPLLPLYMFNQAIPVPVSDVVEKAMSLRSEDRYETVEEFWQAISSVAMQQPQTELIATDSQLLAQAVARTPGLTTLGRQADKLRGRLNDPRAYLLYKSVAHRSRPNTSIARKLWSAITIKAQSIFLGGPPDIPFSRSDTSNSSLADFFISYVNSEKKDFEWAKWIKWQLDSLGRDTKLPPYGIRLNSNLDREIRDATTKAKCVAVVLSPAYLRILVSQPSCIDMFKRNGIDQENEILLICLQECESELRELLESMKYVNLVGMDEVSARSRLLATVCNMSVELTESPHFPGTMDDRPSFPSSQELSSRKSHSEGINVFIASSHSDSDEPLRREFEKHLHLLKRQGTVNLWYDHDTGAGTEWHKEVINRLDTSKLILLLISPDFLASDYCYSIEMDRALERHERGEVYVIPVILRPANWRSTPLGKLQTLPRDARPITMWLNQDEAFLNVTQEIQRVAEMFGG